MPNTAYVRLTSDLHSCLQSGGCPDAEALGQLRCLPEPPHAGHSRLAPAVTHLTQGWVVAVPAVSLGALFCVLWVLGKPEEHCTWWPCHAAQLGSGFLQIHAPSLTISSYCIDAQRHQHIMRVLLEGKPPAMSTSLLPLALHSVCMTPLLTDGGFTVCPCTLLMLLMHVPCAAVLYLPCFDQLHSQLAMVAQFGRCASLIAGDWDDTGQVMSHT